MNTCATPLPPRLSAHKDLPTLLTQQFSRSAHLPGHRTSPHTMTDAPPPPQNPRRQSRRRPQGASSLRHHRTDSGIFMDEPDNATHRDLPCLHDGGSRRTHSPAARRRMTAGHGGPQRQLPIYDPKPSLRREDAFRVVEYPVAAAATMTAIWPCGPGLLDDGESTEYDSDELELCTTQSPEFGDDIFDLAW